MNGKLKLVQELSKQILYNSSCQGLIKIFGHKQVLIKTLWVIFLIISTALCSYLVLTSIAEYLNFDVTTKIRKNKEDQTEFPTITICNKNFFTTDYAFEFLKNDSSNIFEIKKDSFTYYGSIFKIYSNLIMFNKSYEINKFSFSLDDLLLTCYFDTNKCNTNEFQPVVDKMYGLCYKFNSGYNSAGEKVGIKTVKHSGKSFGLHLTLFAGLNQELKKYYFDSGFLIRIDNSSYSVSNYDGIGIKNGVETDIVIKDRIYSFRLPKPYSDCDFDLISFNTYSSMQYKKILNSNNTQYKREYCLDLCLQEYIISKCNCTINGYLSAHFFDVPCLNEESIKCFYSQSFNILKNNNKTQSCYSECPIECNETDFITQISQINMISDLFLNMYLNNTKFKSTFPNGIVTSKTLNDNLARVNIYYEKLSYTVITESPAMSFVSLCSSIGGTLSLFLGVSVLSIVEVIELLIEVILIYSKNIVNAENNKSLA